ncbi:MAG TPA: isopentenyl-diphosphate Delta-isomerase [Candidatus Babeliaceae bacterium]|jgi:isopentenyl-diphosphate delta-isomerase|nr:isopentenyl-diphosphate Delta-isomerase [Candidatus Babeliaceae bacterium]
MSYNSVVLVDQHDNMIGTMEKIAAHRSGKLHRAISVFVFNSDGELLLQRRAEGKYHSGGKWSNTCCSHPRPGENSLDAAKRRLKEEMGLVCRLNHAFSFIYNVELENGLSEHEYDHVFIGTTDTLPEPEKSEVAAFQYLSSSETASDLLKNPKKYTIWFRICFDQVVNAYNQFVEK